MGTEETQNLFCSIDLELTGFDPEKEQILEVGFVLFSLGDKGFNIVEEWSRVFKPTVPVRPKIFGLTGIRQNELDEADTFSEWKDFIQLKIGNAVLVGHSISVDARFLEAAGIVLNGQQLDTLDLVQFILPTHHSYNLENLMHYFGVSHKQAHRALADAKANIIILEKLARIFNGFPEDLKNKIYKLIDKRFFPWEPVLKMDWSGENVDLSSKESQTKETTEYIFDGLEKNTVMVLPFAENLSENLGSYLSKKAEKSLLLVETDLEVLKLWEKGLGIGMFASENLFSSRKFEEFLDTPDLSLEEVRFLLKVLVWQTMNWQTKTILDLNLSFFGGQFKNRISGDRMQSNNEDSVLLCSYKVFLDNSSSFSSSERTLNISGLDKFVSALEQNLTVKAGWGYISQLLKSVYNPENDFGNKEYKNDVINLLASIDLFFGLILITIKAIKPVNEYVSLSDLDDFSKSKLARAAENLEAKLLKFPYSEVSSKIESYCSALKNFFIDEQGIVKWLEVSDSHCSLYQRPVLVNSFMKQISSSFKEINFVSSLGYKGLLEYYLIRLGLESVEEIKFISQKPLNIEVTALDQKNLSQGLLNVADGENLPAIILFEEPVSVKNFYDENYELLHKNGRVFALGYSGGTNKLFRNFSIQDKSLLLATKKYLAGQYPKKLSVNTLIIEKNNKTQMLLPYVKALKDFYGPKGLNLDVLLEIYDHFCMISVASPNTLNRIYVFSKDSGLDVALTVDFIDSICKSE